MKSLFKRVLASATGTVLVLSQLAAVNINAADTASDLVINRAWLTDVPVDELPTIDKLPVVYADQAEQEVEALKWGESDWNNRLETAVLSIAGDGSVTKTTALNKVKDAIKKRLRDTRYFTEEQAARAVDLITDANITLDGKGTAKVEVNLSEAAPLFGEIAQQTWEKDGFNASGDIVIDWSGFSIKGKAIIDIDFSAYDKKASYNVTIDDGTKVYDGWADFEKYATNIFAAAINYAIEQAKAQGSESTRLEAQGMKYLTRAAARAAEAKNFAKAVNDISLEGTDLNQVYADYLAAVDKAIDTAKLSDRAASKARTELAKAPATFTGALTGEKGTKWIDSALDAAKKFANDKVTIDLSSADVAAILDEGYDYSISIPNGYSANVDFSIADDQNDKLTAAIADAYADQWAAEGYELVEVISHKEVTAYANTVMAADGEVYYDIVRIIDKVILDKVKDTTTTTTTTTSETTTTETTTSETTTSETTTSETTTSETTTSETTTSETTTSETTSGDGSSTTESETSSETGTTTTEAGVIVGDYKYELEFDGELGVEELIYWSEETTPFDLSNLAIGMKLTKTNIKDAEDVTVQTFDVTGDFKALQQTPQDFDFQGYGDYALQVALNDVASLEKKLIDAGTDADTVAALEARYKLEQGAEIVKFDGGATYIRVILVLRGDSNLDNEITSKDANTDLILYNCITNLHMTMEDILTLDGVLFSSYPTAELYVKHGHYAGDANDGNGKVSSKDANSILRHYNLERIIYADPEDYAWNSDPMLIGDITPRAELHADPLADENIATE